MSAFERSSRRSFLRQSAALGAGAWALGAARSPSQETPPAQQPAQPTGKRPALVAITLDLEMARNFPRWEDTHWDYEKGNLNQPTKDYAVEAGRRVKAAGGRLHYFAVGQVFEQPDVDWLRGLLEAGHRVGNHTYDHVHLKAPDVPGVQYRFQRAPWLVEGKDVPAILEENIVLAARAMHARLGIAPHGFRTPGGFHNGLSDRRDLQELLLKLGYTWVSSQYPAHPVSEPGEQPDERIYEGIVAAQAAAQPFVYESGLVEVPMSPISDIGAFRTGRWNVEWFLEAIRRAVEWTIATGGTFDFLAHPSCLYVVDPKFQAIELILDLVAQSKGRAQLADLDQLAQRA